LEKPGHLVIGADCGIQTGTGHAMRCLALAQNWKRSGGGATFLLPEGSAGIEQRICNEGFRVEALAAGSFAGAVVGRMVSRRPDLAVLDGYAFGAREQQALSESGIATLIVDDYVHATEYPARWILNQNVFAEEKMYVRRGKDSQLLLGPSYALLRKEFQPWLAWKRKIPVKASRVLITIGGSDPENLSLKVLEALSALGRANLEAVLVVGGSNPHGGMLQSAAERLPLRVRMTQNALDMPALMAWAEVAISGAGGTSYELCYMGLPSLLFVIAENQRGVAEGLSRLSAAVNAGAASEFEKDTFLERMCGLIDSREQREAMSACARNLVDGVGADRVRAALLGRQMKLRAVREPDCEVLFSWANEPAVRGASFHPEPVIWEKHQEWFAERLHDPQSVIYIAETSAGEAVGYARFHLEGERATISVAVAAKFRGSGWGRELIAFAIRRLARERFIGAVDAFVKPENQASIRLFEATCFQRAGVQQVAGQPALRFTWEVGKAENAN
jgi:UDP-2,4-diacetamido-2,4,6-trideoxy-beta-L-altropyranose hydrolase